MFQCLFAFCCYTDQCSGDFIHKFFIDLHITGILQLAGWVAGIPQDSMDKIFISFYTTKKEGSGIGLSLSRQIMGLHGETITVNSEANVKTEFTLRF